MTSLIGIHNLSARKLRFAEKIGGLACPSIAYVRSDIPMQSFGDITLIADKNLANPAQRKMNVFDADIYSSRFPTIYLKTDDDALAHVLKPVQDIADKLNNPVSMQTRIGDLLHRKGIEDLQYATEETLELQMTFLSVEMGIEFKDEALPRLPIKYSPLVSESEELKVHLLNRDKLSVSRDEVTPELQSLCEQAFEAMVKNYAHMTSDSSGAEAIANEESYWRDTMGDNYFNARGEFTFTGLESLSQDQKVLKQGDAGIDRKVLSEQVREEMKKPGIRELYEQWTDRTLSPTITSAYFIETYGKQGNTRRTEATLDAITRQMNRNTQNGEDFMYGAGNIRAQMASGIRSWTKMASLGDRLVSEADFEIFRKQTLTGLTDLTDQLRPRYRFSQERFGGDTLSEILTRCKPNDLKRLKEDFSGLDEEDLSAVSDYLVLLRDAPTAYFEGKFRRAVELSEFSAALVPQHMLENDPELIKTLEAQGVPIAPYSGAGHYKALMKSMGEQYGQDMNPAPATRSEPGPGL